MRSFGAKLHILLLATTTNGDSAKPTDTRQG
jgi:hypothetical protein